MSVTLVGYSAESLVRLTRKLLLAGTSCAALAASANGASAQQSAPGLFITAEGGYTCGGGDGSTLASGVQVGDVFPPLAQTTVGDQGCGWMGRIGLSQSRPNMVGGLIDYWGVFARRQRTEHDSSALGALDPTGVYQNTFGAHTRERRTVIDFEVGKDLGIGVTRDALRLVGGIRYARFDSRTNFAGTYFYAGTPYYFFEGSTRAKFEGIGPRIGLTSRLPLGSGFNLLLAGYGSALHGERQTFVHSVFQAPAPVAITALPFATRQTNSGWARSLEGEVAFSYTLFGNGSELQLGVRGEAWFGQTTGAETGSNCNSGPPLTDGCTRLTKSGTREEITPFLRLNLKIGN